jgi:hypothetical protein
MKGSWLCSPGNVLTKSCVPAQIFEKVLVQNIQFGLSPSFTSALQLIPRWRFIVATLPHVMHCAAAMLQHRFFKMSFLKVQIKINVTTALHCMSP